MPECSHASAVAEDAVWWEGCLGGEGVYLDADLSERLVGPWHVLFWEKSV